MTAAPVLARSLKYTVTISSGEGAGKVFSFDKPVVTIGRGLENDIVFANDSKMSRHHCELRTKLGQLFIRNMSQKNFTIVDGEIVEEKQLSGSVAGKAEIQVGDTILILQVEAPVQGKPSAATPVLKAVPMNNPPKTFSTAPPPRPTVNIGMQKFSATPRSAPRKKSRPPVQNSDSSRLRFYGVIAVIGFVGWWLFSGSPGKKSEVNVRTESDVARAIDDSANAVKELRKQQEATGQDSLQYKSAQEHYVKGFRDYRQGQYARAMQSFQAALSFFPGHELARKYLLQSQRKFDEAVNLSMSQGRKYYQKQNFKMCQSAFANVMIMVKDPAKPKYREAKQFYDECSLRTEGRF